VLQTLKSRVLLVLVVWLALSHVASLWLYAGKHEEAATLLQDALIADRVALTTRLLDGADADERNRLLKRFQSPLVNVTVREAAVPPAPVIEGTRPHTFEHLVGLFLDRPDHWGIRTEHGTVDAKVAQANLLETLSATLNTAPHHLPAGTLEDIRAIGTIATDIAMPGGLVISVSTPLLSVSPFSIFKLWAPLAAMLLSVTLSGAWLLSRATKPLMVLEKAAERFGRDIHAAPLVERGAREVRTAARAFNVMQDRIKRLIEDRTAFAAALAHDIGTPITRLVLRLDDLPESDVRNKITSDVAQMQRMIQSTLNFARMDFQAEPSERFDVVTLVHSIASDVSDGTGTVRVHAPPELAISTKPIALRRALVNITENAVRYGKTAVITVARGDQKTGMLDISVDDAGPGIPSHLHEEAFRPFRRLCDDEASIDGTGLGLSVARSIARSLGGDVTLENRPSGGLRVSVSIPLQG
jgi:signal transduction histidine kinase